ncbi:hypothetical protein ACFOLC_15940 [Lysobacter cavernae]|uniref:DUF1206 domain-containing protein n=1 Tax=Lysobacter cavernae TaxID=1685901 RepID=A0ABV7RV65_9GAMM
MAQQSVGSKTKRVLLHVARAILALLAVLWTLSLLNVFMVVFGTPGYFQEHWLRVCLAVAIVFLPAWGYIKLTEIAARPRPEQSTPAQTRSKPGRILGTPHKRAWFLVFVVGLVLIGGAYITFELQHSYSSFAKAVFDRPGRYIGYKTATYLGISFAVAGLFFSVLYDSTLGRVIAWVRHGSGDAH